MLIISKKQLTIFFHEPRTQMFLTSTSQTLEKMAA
jgi:hypothetical protein